jgi:hypothetical protein
MISRWLKFALPLLCLSASVLVTQIHLSKEEVLQPPSLAIPRTLFGLHIHRAATTTPWPKDDFGTWRLWDAYVAWPWLEPKQDEWHFETLDKYLALAEQNKVEVLLPLAFSPAWASARPNEPSAYEPGFAAEPRNLQIWRNYVRTVATRYKGRIHYYELWNEPNLQKFYSGTVEQMVALAREAYLILKEVDPSITVVSPSATGDRDSAWLEEYLRKGGGAYADVIGYHFYVTPKPPEAMVTSIRKVQQIMAKHGVGDKPLWNTETGWMIANSKGLVEPKVVGFPENMKVLTADEAAGYVARSFIIAWGAGLQRFYWYAWDNHVMGLTEVDGKTLKLPAKAYAEVQKWLVGAQMTACKSDKENTWVCELKRDAYGSDSVLRGYLAWIVWNPDKSFSFNLPQTWGVQQARDLSGTKRSLPQVNQVEVSPSPLLLERLAQ